MFAFLKISSQIHKMFWEFQKMFALSKFVWDFKNVFFFKNESKQIEEMLSEIKKMVQIFCAYFSIFFKFQIC